MKKKGCMLDLIFPLMMIIIMIGVVIFTIVMLEDSDLQEKKCEEKCESLNFIYTDYSHNGCYCFNTQTRNPVKIY